MKIVKWYLDVFEDGNDTRDILNMYQELNVKYKKLQKDYEIELERLKRLLKKSQKEVENLYTKLQSQ